MRLLNESHHIRSVTSTGTFDTTIPLGIHLRIPRWPLNLLVGVDRPVLKRSSRTIDESRFVQRITMEFALDIELVTYAKHISKGDQNWQSSCSPQGIVDDCRCRAPILVYLQTCDTSFAEIVQTFGSGIVTLTNDAKVHGKDIASLHHAFNKVLVRCAISSKGTSATTVRLCL